MQLKSELQGHPTAMVHWGRLTGPPGTWLDSSFAAASAALRSSCVICFQKGLDNFL